MDNDSIYSYKQPRHAGAQANQSIQISVNQTLNEKPGEAIKPNDSLDEIDKHKYSSQQWND